MNALSGPMFERADNGVWKSVHNANGGHYNNFGCLEENGMLGLRDFFPDATANELNFCLFSTSGIHGSYTTIEEAEKAFKKAEHEEWETHVTFLIVQPRICTVRYGNCIPKSADDFKFLKKLRRTSWTVVQKIGAP